MRMTPVLVSAFLACRSAAAQAPISGPLPSGYSAAVTVAH